MVGGHHRLLRNMTPRGPSSNSDMEVDMDAVNTSRLSLRPVQLTDLEELYALSRMPEVNLFNPSGPDGPYARSGRLRRLRGAGRAHVP